MFSRSAGTFCHKIIAATSLRGSRVRHCRESTADCTPCLPAQADAKVCADPPCRSPPSGQRQCASSFARQTVASSTVQTNRRTTCLSSILDNSARGQFSPSVEFALPSVLIPPPAFQLARKRSYLIARRFPHPPAIPFEGIFNASPLTGRSRLCSFAPWQRFFTVRAVLKLDDRRRLFAGQRGHSTGPQCLPPQRQQIILQ